ncbi:MAG: Spy0128 family protein [Saccharofermentanales bacterium]
MKLTQDAAKALASRLLSSNNGSRVALVRYGDYASVFDFQNNVWIMLNESTSSASLIGNNLYTSDLSKVKSRIDAIRSNRDTGNIRGDNNKWYSQEDQGGTTTEAGLILTKLVAQEATQDSYAIFMSDGVPTSRMIGQSGNADGLYGITRDGSGNATSDAEKSEALAAAASLKALSNTGVFSVAITLGLSGTNLANAREVMKAVASKNSMYFETSSPSSNIDDIYISIGKTIVDKIANNAVVTDIVPKYFSVSNLGPDMVATPMPDGTTKIEWTIGNLMDGTTENQYTLKLKEGYYGIIDTNESAVLTYSDHYLGDDDPNTLADRTFPIPEIKAQPTAKDDSYTTPDNVNPYEIPNTILDNDNNQKIDNNPYDDRSGNDYTPLSDRNVQDYKIVIVDPLGEGEGEITSFNYETGKFTYVPNQSRPADPGKTTYTVDFTYKLVSKDAAGAYVSNVATVTITVPYQATGSLALSGKKTLTGRDLATGEFEFELYEGSTLLKTVSNQDDGSFSFNLNYTLSDVGTKTYKVKEKAGSLGGVTYAINEYTVKVKIEDNRDGTLKVTVLEGNTTGLNFRNTYAATGSLALSGKKTLTGRGLSAGEFEFELYEGSTLLKTVSNQDDGSFSFNLNYTLSDVGTKTYKVKEKAGSLGGVTYATNEYTVKVAISDNGNGTLSVVVTEGSATALNFENTYAAAGSLALSGKKTLTGRGLSAGEFEFELYEGSTLLKTVSNQTDGSFSFNLNYTLADVGTKTYKVKEKAGSLGGVTYATNEYTVKVAISDNGNGTLNVVVTEGSATALNFENTYAATGSLALSGKKTLTGRGLSADEFEFELYEGSTLLETVSNQADGSFSFTTLNYTLSDVGTKTYKVIEKTGSLGGVTYATNLHIIKVAISDNGNGTLSVVVTEGNATGLNFENTYAATGRLALSGKKTLTGRGLSAGEFEFELYEGSTLLKTVSNQTDGSFSFNLNYTLSDVGTKTYTVKEKAGSLDGVTYATNEYTVKVAISDNGNGTLNVVVTEGNATALNFRNTYAAAGSLTLSGKKILTGRDLSADEFEFELYEGSALLETVSNRADGSFSFATLNYTLADVGTKIYKVIEKTGSLGGVTYATNEYTVKVAISDNGNGTLNVVVTEGSATALNFENTYAATGSLALSGKKTLTGRDLSADEFKFELYEGSALLETVSNQADGSFSFNLNYTLSDVGTKIYTVKEKAGSLDGVTYATNEYTVKVAISDNGNGTLNVVVTEGSATALNFENTYAATGSLALSGKKILTGRGLSADEFEFELYEGSALLETVSNRADGSFSFTTLNYTLGDVGTKTYKVIEKTGSLGGVTYATNEYTVKVAISDNGNGTLNVVVTEGSATALNFENTYAATGSLALSGKKTLTGRDLAADEFEFELYEGSALLETVSNRADGSFSFATLNYTLGDVGTKTYKVIEKTGSLGGVTYATNLHIVKVAISDNGNGLLNVVVTEGNATALNFENTYAATGSLALSGKKTLTGRDLVADEFEFELYEGSALLETVSNRADGSFSFTTLNYTLGDVGTKTYTVKEKAGSLDGVTYATNEYTVKVAISDNGNGTLNVVVTEGSATALNFENTYAATGRLALSGKKILTGRGLSADEFEFELYEGSALLETVSNRADGSFSFTTLNYTLGDVGTKTYKVIEKTGSLGGVTYATNEYTVKVAISDNGNGTLNVVVTEGSATALNFENTYAAIGSLALSGKKTLTGRDLSADEFEFELYEGSALLETVSNQADGSFSFATLNYTLGDVGTKTYKVIEKTGSLGGVTYATNLHIVKVAISDNGNGLLNVVVTEGNATALNFENTYAATGSLALSGKKTLTGRDLVADEFEFELYEGSALLETVSNRADGSFSFTTLNYTLGDVGTKTYTVKEKAGSQGAIIYDTTVFVVEVEISDNGDGTLNVSLTEDSDDPEALDFTNILKTYYIELLKLDSRDEKTPLSGATFELRRAVGTEILIPGDLLETLTTDSEGRALTTAAYAPGTYFLVETVPPLGFHPITKPMQIIISDEAENGSTITVTITNDFISAPSLMINKQVSNVTVGGAAADLVAAKVGETVEYTVVVVNDGNTILTDVYLTDDQAVIGGAVEVDGTTTAWITGPGGLAMIELGDMVPGDAITIVYTYDIAAEDLAREPITNTATANGTMQPTPKDPEGAVIEVSDSAIVTVEEIPLGVVAIELTKNVQNVTNGGTPGDLAGGRPGDMFRYTLVITNTGEADLSDLILTDDQVAAGGTVKQITADTTLTWIANGSNAAYLELGDLASGESIVLTYEYTTPASDAGEIRINRAHVIATATATLESETPVTVEDEDTASIAVESIPKTGEQDNGLPMVGLALLVAAGVLTILRRRNRKSQEQ